MHPGKRALIAQIEAELARERYEERAAILEFDAGFSREEAERRARASVRGPLPPKQRDLW